MLSVSVTSLHDGVKGVRTAVEALSATTEAMLRDIEISKSTSTVHNDIKFSGLYRKHFEFLCINYRKF